MPRLKPSLLRRAASQNILLFRLLHECRDLASARNELRWLTAHILDHESERRDLRNLHIHRKLWHYVDRRSKGEPLQYILGSQPFGELEILCRPGVLIPRPETEVYTAEVARLVKKIQGAKLFSQHDPLRIADLCTGSGCISLLLHSLLRPPSKLNNGDVSTADLIFGDNIEILGTDMSAAALKIAHDNLQHNRKLSLLHISAEADVSFQNMNILELGREAAKSHPLMMTENDLVSPPDTALLPLHRFLAKDWPVIISNPPYISPADYAPGGTTARSVREHEPKLALVPPEINPERSSRCLPFTIQQADQFYAALLFIACQVKTQLLVMEIGDSAQAERVRDLAVKIMQPTDRMACPEAESASGFFIETWNDDGGVETYDNSALKMRAPPSMSDKANARAVAVWQDKLARWRTSRVTNS